MTSKTNEIDPVAEIAALRERDLAELESIKQRGIARLAEVEQEHDRVRNELAATEAQHRAEREALEREFGELRRAKELEIERKSAKDAFDTTVNEYVTAAKRADELVSGIDAAIKTLADTYAAAVEAELARVNAGKTLQSQRYNLTEERGLFDALDAPHVADKRLATRNDKTLNGIREITAALRPEITKTLDQLWRAELWRAPSYVFVQGVRTLVR